MTYDPKNHHRRSIRLTGYNYAGPGAYFVTICARERKHVLGRVKGGKVVLSDVGGIVAESWQWLAERHPYVALDVWVVMPNHLHGIIVINDGEPHGDMDTSRSRGASRRAPTVIGPPLKRKPLGQLIGAFKTVSTKRINQTRGTAGMSFWQRGYYEHIVRNERDMDRIRWYIIDHPLKWPLVRNNR